MAAEGIKSSQTVRHGSPGKEGKVVRLSGKVSQPNGELRCRMPQERSCVGLNYLGPKEHGHGGKAEGIPKMLQPEAVSWPNSLKQALSRKKTWAVHSHGCHNKQSLKRVSRRFSWHWNQHFIDLPLWSDTRGFVLLLKNLLSPGIEICAIGKCRVIQAMFKKYKMYFPDD